MRIRIATIGFTKKPLSTFIELLHSAGVTKVIDTRLRPNSQLSGFAKSDDLSFILGRFGIAYEHCPILTPTDALLRQYRTDHDWDKYELGYRSLIEERYGIEAMERAVVDGQVPCLLCSEDSPAKCHRRVLAEMYASKHADAGIVHLQ